MSTRLDENKSGIRNLYVGVCEGDPTGSLINDNGRFIKHLLSPLSDRDYYAVVSRYVD